jgi:hypothetical protein
MIHQHMRSGWGRRLKSLAVARHALAIAAAAVAAAIHIATGGTPGTEAAAWLLALT